MISRYGIFCRVVENGNFTRTARELGCSQSAVSQAVRALEKELNLVLIDRRKKDQVRLTDDGRQIYPYIRAIDSAWAALERKKKEMESLEDSVIRIGTFTSVSRNFLPVLLKTFKEEHPSVEFFLRQGEYTSIEKWIREGSIDLGFLNADLCQGLSMEILYTDPMMAVLPPGHPLSGKEEVSMQELSGEPFILLDEGDFSLPLSTFVSLGLTPRIEYRVYDDYSILAMVEQGLGVSMMYNRVLRGFDTNVRVVPVREKPERTIALAWGNEETIPRAAREFALYAVRSIRDMAGTLKEDPGL